MQSSAMMAIRGAVLLACLVAVPVLAICGKKAPEVVKSLIRDYTGAPEKVASTAAGSTEAPVFRPGLMGPPARPPSQAPASLPDSNSGSAARLSGADSGSPLPLRSAPSGPKAASDAGIVPNGPSGMRTVAAETLPQRAVVSTISHQVANAIGSGKEANHQAIHNARPEDSTAAGFPPDYFRAAETRLRGLGATYYLLETLGPVGDQYRFVCKVAAGRQPEQMLAFFAVDSDPLAAMNNVARQVEGWRAELTQ